MLEKCVSALRLGLLVAFSVQTCANLALAQRVEQDLGKAVWSVWLDRDAKWKDDVPVIQNPVDLKSLPANPPTGGWDHIYLPEHKRCHLPGTCHQEAGSIQWFEAGAENCMPTGRNAAGDAQQQQHL